MPPDESQIHEPGIPPVDRDSKKENRYLINRAERKEQMESTGHNISILLLKLVVGSLVVVGVCRFIHLLLPDQYKWLKPEELSYIDEFFIHGTIGALVVEFLGGKILKN